MQVAVFDVESAFRIIPTHPEDWPLLVVTINRLVHYNFCFNFRAACSPEIFGFMADMIVQIFLHLSADAVLKWADNFLFFQYPVSKTIPYSYSYDKTLI